MSKPELKEYELNGKYGQCIARVQAVSRRHAIEQVSEAIKAQVYTIDEVHK